MKNGDIDINKNEFQQVQTNEFSNEPSNFPEPSSRRNGPSGGGSNSQPKNLFQDTEIVKILETNEIFRQSNNPSNLYVTCRVCNKSFKLDSKKALDGEVVSYRTVSKTTTGPVLFFLK